MSMCWNNLFSFALLRLSCKAVSRVTRLPNLRAVVLDHSSLDDKQNMSKRCEGWQKIKKTFADLQTGR